MKRRGWGQWCCLAAAAAAAIAVMGCGTKQASLPRWQDSIHQYIDQRGGGDPAILRDVTWRGEEPGFALLGSADPRHATDVHAVLLDHRVIDGRPWFVFLAGVVRHAKVRDIRLTALSVDAAGYTWHTSRRDRHGYHTYHDYNVRLAEQRFPDRRDTPAEYAGFPCDGDRFDLGVEPGPLLVAVHRASGARWQLLLKAPGGEREPAENPHSEPLARR